VRGEGGLAAFAEVAQPVLEASGPRAADANGGGGPQRST